MLDVATIVQGETKFFSVLMLAWGMHLLYFSRELSSLDEDYCLLYFDNILYFISGLVADIDIESEKYRWMGSARLDFYVCFLFISKFSSFSFATTDLFACMCISA